MESKRAQGANPLQFLSTVKESVAGAFMLARALPGFFREKITVKQAEEDIRRALELRAETFLELARTRIYADPGSPYLKLLKIARCEFSYLQTQVRRYGLEATLEELAREGVYLTSDEFKGKKEVARGGRSFRVLPEDFERGASAAGFVTQSSGTGGRPVSVVISLDWLAVRAFGHCVFFSAHDFFSYSHALYDATLPGTAATNNLLTYAKLGAAIDRWFARKIPSTSKLAAGYHFLITYLIVLMGKVYGFGFPRPESIEIEDLHRIVQWVAEKNRQGGKCCITAAASSAVRIARLALEMGLSLQGTKFIVHGEPFTEAKREVIIQSGAAVTPRYAFSGGGIVGFGCANPLFTDEIHVNQNLVTLVPHPRPLNDDSAIHPLLFTTVEPLASRLLLNVENGDYATLEKRNCGCALERVGFTLHLHHIRSFEKFTSEGMNYFYGDLFEFFEKTLPSEFGGGPGEYQLVEEEDNGQTRLTLVVHPKVGAVDEAKLLLRLHGKLAQGSSANRFQSTVWQDAGTLRVRRQAPYASPTGKILPLHISR